MKANKLVLVAVLAERGRGFDCDFSRGHERRCTR